MNLKELLHKRILVAEKSDRYSSDKTIKEFKILEISPSGNWVKIMDMEGRKYWKRSTDIVPIEVLESVEKPPKE